MNSSFIIFLLSIFVLTKAASLSSSVNDGLQQQHLSVEHEDLEELFNEDGEEDECICDDEEDRFKDGNSTRVKRQCGCGYGYCGCAAAPAPAQPAGGNPKNVFVVPFPIPSPPAPIPASAPTPIAPAQAIALPPQPQIPQQPYILPQTSILSSGSSGNACDRLRLILTLTNQLEGLKLIEIAGQCVVQLEK
uniref:Uncharacterized protein n=1 Tax=Panagrolaimus sp. PS1159 TaxID=55785 RepID=A0AC35GIE0_9BILA